MRLRRFFKLKYLGLAFLLGLITAGIWYSQLSNRHKAIVKTRLLHGLRIIDHDWEIMENDSSVQLESPELLVDNIYQSMDGPQAILNLELNSGDSGIKWITGFKAEVFREGTQEHNNDFLCHTNIDFFNGVHYKNLKLPKRINSQYPRLGTLSNGINQLNFPEGFGFPVADKDAFIIASRTLNHNIEDAFFKVKHKIEFSTKPAEANLKPLVPKALVLLQDYNRENPDNPEQSDAPNLCLPLDLKNHSFPNEDGVRYAAHWVLPKGEHLYKFNVTYQLRLTENTTIHAMAAHLHPDAQKFTLYDLTANRAVYTINCENYDEKIGLKDVSTYSSEEGLPLYADHEYELQLHTYNPSDGFRDMMAVLFIYVYDREMDEHLKALQKL
ncbi:hypothetical protein C5O00_00610 [Pukyongia salina]|uniref:Uncharacterized protein n=1 Tax=Pukyongia salina TaxID=2094025 RepID=A0A2S0HSX8_9FLAO|nr:hypothetical protein [Pukyongia salina]AVI49742.1 hypothetical protein C5O00_00610 [Pukyongia salina]